MKTRSAYYILILLSSWVLLVNSLQAQQSRTGTHLNSKALPSEILALEVPNEVERIRQLILDGRKDDALKLAEAYIDKVDRVTLPHETMPKYFAWNAYCTVLTSLHKVEEAIAACSMAMAFEPRKWSAVNNRGTAKFVAGQYEAALADYQVALSMVDEANIWARGTIEHNIDLAMASQ